MRELRRVVITGIGCVTPLGCGIEHVWKRILLGECGISKLKQGFLPDNVSVHVAAHVPRGKLDDDKSAFDEDAVFGRLVGKELALFTQFGMYASDLAMQHAWGASSSSSYKKEMSEAQLERFGVALATGGIGSLLEITEAQKCLDQSFKKLSPYFVPKVLVNMAAGHVSIRHGLKGPLHSVATACAAGAHAVGDAFNFIRLGAADRMLAGGTEASIDPLSLAGFARMRALSPSPDPSAASRPFDASRSGFVIGEGACVLVLEELSAALAREATIIAEIVGYGQSGDAHHATLPSPMGDGAYRSMRAALQDAGVSPWDIGFVSAHATSTAQGDAIEAAAIARLFEDECEATDRPPLFVSSTKGATGHLLGAAGALELAFTALALRDGRIPPTLNLVHPDPSLPVHWYATPQMVGGGAGLDYLEREEEQEVRRALARESRVEGSSSSSSSTRTTQARGLRFALKNSFGFGGTNASLVLAKFVN